MAVLECLGLSMVGPFEFINGDLDRLSDAQILTHCRYYFDLPEFQTILVERDCPKHTHFGFWRDDPSANPVGICEAEGGRKVAESAAKHTAAIKAAASNLFGFALNRIERAPPSDDVRSLSEALTAFVAGHGIEIKKMGGRSCPFKRRRQNVVAPSFHRFGLVVPFEDDVGYRPIGYSNGELRRILKRMHSDKQRKRKVDASEMEVILTNVCLADDEGDPGMGYELGIAFFCSFPMFGKHAQRLLTNAYALTQRDGFGPILKAHLQQRDGRKAPYRHLPAAKNSILRYALKTKRKGGDEQRENGRDKKHAEPQGLDDLSSDEE